MTKTEQQVAMVGGAIVATGLVAWLLWPKTVAASTNGAQAGTPAKPPSGGAQQGTPAPAPSPAPTPAPQSQTMFNPALNLLNMVQQIQPIVQPPPQCPPGYHSVPTGQPNFPYMCVANQ